MRFLSIFRYFLAPKPALEWVSECMRSDSVHRQPAPPVAVIRALVAVFVASGITEAEKWQTW
jgi:hypothetical protein